MLCGVGTRLWAAINSSMKKVVSAWMYVILLGVYFETHSILFRSAVLTPSIRLRFVYVKWFHMSYMPYVAMGATFMVNNFRAVAMGSRFSFFIYKVAFISLIKF